jgi:DNA-binding transcriptional ArsR family regulator
MPRDTHVDLIQGAGPAAAVLHPLRRRILESVREPASASALARRLGIPRQKVNYHLRKLEKQALVELVEERRCGNCTERVVRATARSYLISPEVLGRLASDPDAIEDKLSAAYLVAQAGRLIHDLALLRERAAKSGRKVATLTLRIDVRFADPAARAAFARELATAVARLAAKYHDGRSAGGRRFRFLVGGYPAVR